MNQGVCHGLEFIVSRWMVCTWCCCIEGMQLDLSFLLFVPGNLLIFIYQVLHQFCTLRVCIKNRFFSKILFVMRVCFSIKVFKLMIKIMTYRPGMLKRRLMVLLVQCNLILKMERLGTILLVCMLFLFHLLSHLFICLPKIFVFFSSSSNANYCYYLRDDFCV